MIIGKRRQNGAPFQYVPWGHVSELLTNPYFHKTSNEVKPFAEHIFSENRLCQQLRFGDPLNTWRDKTTGRINNAWGRHQDDDHTVVFQNTKGY